MELSKRTTSLTLYSLCAPLRKSITQRCAHEFFVKVSSYFIFIYPAELFLPFGDGYNNLTPNVITRTI